MDKKRPLGIWIISLAAITVGLLIFKAYVIVGIEIIYKHNVLIHYHPWKGNLPPLDYLKIIILPAIISFSFLVSGVFILRLKNLVRLLLMAQALYWVYFGIQTTSLVFLIDIVFHQEQNTKTAAWNHIIFFACVFFLPALATIYYLNRKKIKELFK
ncbi:MAG: hypothetical protein AB1481_05725 [Candidatus Omnitrophota bacterium]